MTREQRAVSVAVRISDVIDEEIRRENLDAGEGLAVMQMLARNLQSAVDVNMLMNIDKFRGVSYDSVAGKWD